MRLRFCSFREVGTFPLYKADDVKLDRLTIPELMRHNDVLLELIHDIRDIIQDHDPDFEGSIEAIPPALNQISENVELLHVQNIELSAILADNCQAERELKAICVGKQAAAAGEAHPSSSASSSRHVA
ncbi:hypothetical protein FKP32DRAFT_1676217 [Trametes sanguinea]|nr:hypothetical protein FKP32DRAFT_1676217 [Trametes sanguinea]